jgi:ACR3 family arsenite efflux pump ArsB
VCGVAVVVAGLVVIVADAAGWASVTVTGVAVGVPVMVAGVAVCSCCGPHCCRGAGMVTS